MCYKSLFIVIHLLLVPLFFPLLQQTLIPPSFFLPGGAHVSQEVATSEPKWH